MRFGVDIDGTITAMPEVFRCLCRNAIRCGDQVFVITAGIAGHGAKDTEVGRQRELAALGMRLGVHYTRIFLAHGADRREVAAAKAELCRNLHVDVMFDNDPLNVAACRQVTKVLVPSDNPAVYS